MVFDGVTGEMLSRSPTFARIVCAVLMVFAFAVSAVSAQGPDSASGEDFVRMAPASRDAFLNAVLVNLPPSYARTTCR